MRRLVGSTTLLLLAACTTPDTTGPADPPQPQEPPPSTTAAPDNEPPTGRPVTIALAGDVHFEGVLRDRLADPATALGTRTRTLREADLAIVNLETAIGTGGRPEPGKRYTFQAPPAAFQALAAAGIDVASMANNHALDYGRAALTETFHAIGRSPLSVIGIGRDVDEAFRPAVTEIDGTTVATFAATVAGADPTADPTAQWAATRTRPGTADAIDPRRLLREVREATEDVVVVFLHWGTQEQTCPDDRQRRLARQLVDAGADVVAGSHAHRLQGDGRLGSAYVAYGLGNHVWYTDDGPSADTGVLTLTVETTGRVTDAAWAPARIGADGLPAPVRGAARAEAEQQRTARRGCAGLDQSP